MRGKRLPLFLCLLAEERIAREHVRDEREVRVGRAEEGHRLAGVGRKAERV